MGRESVLAVLAGSTGAPPPRGEVWVAPAVLEEQGLPNDPAGVVALAARLGADLCFLSRGGPQALPDDARALHEAVSLAHAHDLACGAVVDGPWQRVTGCHGLLPTLKKLASRSGDVPAAVAEHFPAVDAELRAWAEAGADLILLADDFAYGTGLYFPPAVFAAMLLPHYRRLLCSAADLALPLGFHCDGDVGVLLPALVDAGFSFFSLEPEAVALAGVQRRYGDRIALLSGIRAAWLSPQLLAGEDGAEITAEIAALARGGRLILASSCGLFDPASPAALREVYTAADDLVSC